MRLLPGHDVTHAKDLGWENLGNGKLLAAASDAEFVVMLTVDKNIKHQQNLEELPVSVVELDIPDSRLPAIVAIAPSLNEAIALAPQYRFISVDQNGKITTAAKR